MTDPATLTGSTPSTVDLVALLRHMEWADARVWGAVLALPEDRAAPALLERLRHIHEVQRHFLSMARGEPFVRPPAGALARLTELASWAHADYAAARDAVASLDAAALARAIPVPERMARAAGGASLAPATLADALVQVAVHSTHHRGQVNLLLRELGGEPPLVDYIAWAWLGRPDAEWPAAVREAHAAARTAARTAAHAAG